MKELSDRIAALTPEQRAVFELLRKSGAKKRSAHPAAPPPIPRRAGTEPAALSFDQERLWFLGQLDPESAAYNIDTAIRMKGPLDVPVLRTALAEVVRRHEAWRTVFRAVDGRPVQVPLPELSLEIPVVDLRELPAAEREAAGLAMAIAEAQMPMDLARGPLVRVRLLCLADDEHICLMTVHHIVSDWVSFTLAWMEVAALYPAFLEGKPSPLPEPLVQYADFAAWQRSWLSGETLESAIDFWTKELADFPHVLELPTDRPRPAAQTTRGGRAKIALPPARAEAFRTLARKEGVTPFMAVLAAFDALLCRWSGQEKILAGSPNANRNRPEIEGLLGFFVSQLVFATDLSGDPSFRELLARARKTALAAYAHQELPFGKLVEALRPERDASRPPLAQVNFLLLDTASSARIELPSLTFSVVEVDNGLSPFETTLMLFDDNAAGIHGWLEYNRDLWDSTTMFRLAEAFEILVERVSANPEIRLAEIPLFSEGAAHQVLREWNDTAAEEIPRRADRLFEERAAETPDAPALVVADPVFSDLVVTYGELDRAANRLAHRLRRLGVDRESRVGLRTGRGPELLVGLLGIWKAGGAYVPLDPGYPEERIAFLLEDAGIEVVVTEAKLPALRAERVRAVALEGVASLAGEPGTRPEGWAEPGDLAYVIYTSGTTGRPKGVMAGHGNLASTLLTSRLEFGWSREDRIPALAPYSFDIFLFEAMGPLTTGGTVELVPLVPALDLDRLMAALPAATRLHAVPALMRQICALVRAGAARPAGLKTLFVGGDAVPPDLLAEMRGAFPGAEIRVLYGPTEGTIICASHRVSGEGEASRAMLGRPLANVDLRVVDRQGGLALVGAPGELWIGGPGVTRGYLSREDLTVEKFVTRDGRRWYRTGDLARRLADGSLEFAGRVDQQVKVRGFRVEPGEIEARLAAHPAVKEAVVLARGVEGGDKRLAAYVVAEGSAGEEELRAWVGEALPEYMVPSLVAVLPGLPVTAHGKVDKKALLALEAPREAAPAPVADRTAPRTPAEEVLAAIWREVLRVDEVGVHDNFFRLGGDSILSIQVVARARQAGLALTPRQMFESQTIAALAAVAVLAEGEEEQGAVEGEAPLTPIQIRFFAEERPDPGWFDQTLLFEVREKLDPVLLRRAVAALVEHHDALRLRFFREDGRWRQVHAPVQEAPFTWIDAPALPEARELQGGFDLAAGPLFRAILLTGASEARLLLAAHHLVVDGVSWRILLEDLAAAYAGRPLPAKTTSWKRWAERLAAHARSEEVLAELPFWKGEPAAQIPADRNAGPNTVGSAFRVDSSLDAETTEALLKRAPEAYRTEINDLLLTALARTLASWTGRGRHRIELEGHGREEVVPGVDLSRTVGWFTTAFPVVLDVEGRSGPGEAIRAVKETLRAIPNRGIGYGLLRYLAPEGECLASAAEPEVGFNYLGQVDGSVPGALAPADEPPGPAESPRTPRRHLLDADALVHGGRLRVTWTASRNRHDEATVERLARAFLSEVEALVAHCLSPEAGGYTPSDFPLARVGPETIAAVLGSRRDIEDVYPLAPLQRGMLFHTLYTPGSEIYFEQLAATVRGGLDVAAFGRAFQAVVDREPVLRTAFLWEGLPAPLQVVRRGVEMPWVLEDWRGVPAEEVDGCFAAYAAADRARGFDLGRPPLQRAALLRTGEEEYRLLWSFHHLLFDGWCFSLLFREIFTFYAAFRGGGEAAPGPVHPYRDYIAWLEKRDLAQAEAWWRERLAGFVVATALPFAEGDEGRAAADYEERGIVLAPPLAVSLQEFAQREGVTLNTLVQGAWALLLSRMSGARDVVFGAVVAGRPADLPGVEEMIGLFINTLPVRVEVDPGASVAAWLRDLQARQAEMRSWEWSPLSDVQRWSGVPAGEPLFHSLLVFENYPLDPSVGSRLPDLAIDAVEVSERTNYPLTLTAVVRDEFLLRASFDRRLAVPTVERMLGHLEALLAALAADPGRALGDLPAVSGLVARELPRGPALPEGAATAPRTAVEETLSRVWRAVLRLDRVGVHDDFFRLGGDSILSLQIVVKAREEGLRVTPKQIFESSTIAALAAVAIPLEKRADEEEPARPEKVLEAPLGEDPSVEDLYPLAPLQRGMLLHGAWAPGSTLYLEQISCDLVGDLDVSAFTRAWQRVVDRHPALRTAFLWEGLDEPLQVVRRGVELPWTVEDWRALPEQEERLRAWTAEDFGRVFDLREAPLLRTALLRTAVDRHRFVWSFHHLLFDGWCFALLFREVFAFYGAFCRGEDLHLPEPRPYRDYIAWLAERDPAESEAYWRRTLAGFAAATPVPLDTPGGLPGRPEPRDEILHIPAGPTAALEAFSRGRRLTVNTLVQAAWGLLLSRFSGERDVVFGTVVSGRPPELPGVESMVGLFINTQPVRIAAEPHLPVGAWLARVQDDQVEMRQHGWSPLADVQGWSELPPGEPLFHTLLAFENFPMGEDLEEGGGGIGVREFHFVDRADHPLSFSVTPSTAGLGLRLSHDPRIEKATARRLLGSFLTLLDGLAADPGRRLDEVPILSEAERDQLLAWSAGEEPSGGAACLHELFEAQARRTPEAVALVDDRGETTYAELERRANRLANTLRAMGIGPEVRVGLSVPRSAEMVTAILGILKAGGAYVPIDPETPPDRRAFLLEDASASVVIAESFFEDPSWLSAPDTAPDSGVTPESLAYVIYTSGSTGLPKGVMVRHASAVAYARSMAAVYEIGPGDRAVQFASVSFDASVEEIFTALGRGATLFIRTRVEDVSSFLARCRAWRLTHLSLPTAYWHQIAAALEGGDLDLHPELRLVVIGGERALPERWAAWGRGAGARARLVNSYGPTEATIAATVHEHPGTACALPRREVPIGRPLPGVTAHVLGRDLRLVPAGAVGELCLGGGCLARGYLGRPELTAERFVPDPFGSPGARLYRTGDLALRLADGTLEFAGRADSQVKVRGFRIELGEVEAALSAHPGVREAVATTREDVSGSRRLIAFAVPKVPGDPLADLRTFLTGRLPAYMVPSDLGVLDALPVTPAGKLDRRALDAIGISRGPEAGFVAPGNPVEEALSAIWSELLAVERVSLDDDFFALGGHSLLATQLVSRVRRELGVDLPLNRLFELRTLSDLAREVLARTLAEADGLDGLMAELDGLSDEEAMALLEKEGA